MALLDLKKYFGLPVAYDGSEIIPQETGVEIGKTEVVKIADIRPQLLNPDLSCPVVFYTVFSKIDRKSLLKRKNLQLDIFTIPQNLAGIEYVKTKGMHSGKYALLVEVVYGYLTIVLQTGHLNEESEKDAVTTTIVMKLKKGEKFVIPPNTDFTFVNTRQSNSIVSVIHSNKGQIQEVFDSTRGAALYMIRKNARQEVVQNPYYRNVNRKKACRPQQLYKFYGLTAKTPIFKQILRKYDRFRWLHDSGKIEWDKLPVCT